MEKKEEVNGIVEAKIVKMGLLLVLIMKKKKKKMT